MLRLERGPRHIALRLEPMESFFNRRVMWALAIAIALHGVALLLFRVHIVCKRYEKCTQSQPPLVVTCDLGHSNRHWIRRENIPSEFDSAQKQYPLELHIPPPPMPSIPFSSEDFTLVEDTDRSLPPFVPFDTLPFDPEEPHD